MSKAYLVIEEDKEQGVGRAVSFPKTGKIASVEGIRIMDACLIEHLRQVEDFRTSDGRRHPLWLVLLFVIMGTMSGYVGYRAWGDFVKRHRRALIKTFEIQKHGVPSYSTIRRIAMGIDFDKLVTKFNYWAQNYVEIEESEWCRIDGKSIKKTVQDYEQSCQNFVSIVTVFASKRGLLVNMEEIQNKEEREIVVVQNLIAALELKNAVFSFDSLHRQKNLPVNP
ncbi:ISAs1 family transposase [Nostoc sp. TCL240-02]|uniref:ISAs1 family transposase n=1 Tax=Nostoc sp. TCL240-02 TaxID=2572090 RepID=UPI00157F98FD|nr:ISAs1 family transposase [Nostoc sp. TCL240-02]QKQ74016.1 ISAs1 family transposase [Nostoc sp. TCL240-02]